MAYAHQNLQHVNLVKVAIVGHSFIRRLHDHIPYNPRLRTMLDISEIWVEWFCKGGYTFQRFRDNKLNDGMGLDDMLAWEPDIVYIEMATNDLDSADSHLTVAQRAMTMINDLLQAKVKVIILGEVLHRYADGFLLAGQFNEKADQYNLFMKQTLINTNVPRNHPDRFRNHNIIWWEHMKLKASQFQLYLDDGIHLTDDPGLKRLYFSIRTAVLVGLKALHQ